MAEAPQLFGTLAFAQWHHWGYSRVRELEPMNQGSSSAARRWRTLQILVRSPLDLRFRLGRSQWPLDEVPRPDLAELQLPAAKHTMWSF